VRLKGRTGGQTSPANLKQGETMAQSTTMDSEKLIKALMGIRKEANRMIQMVKKLENTRSGKVAIHYNNLGDDNDDVLRFRMEGLFISLDSYNNRAQALAGTAIPYWDRRKIGLHELS